MLSADSDESAINKVVSYFFLILKVAVNINIKIPEEGEKIKRLVEIAKERNIPYKPSAEAYSSLIDYIDRKGLDNPMGGDHKHHHGGPGSMIPPIYNPEPMMNLPPPNQFQPGPGFQ